MVERSHSSFIKWVVLIQGVYYLTTGLWSLINIASFMDITGPKTDVWVVKTVGALSSSIGLSLIISARKRNGNSYLPLSLSTALSFMTVDLYYGFKGIISEVYLFDAIIQAGIMILIFISYYRKSVL